MTEPDPIKRLHANMLEISSILKFLLTKEDPPMTTQPPTPIRPTWSYDAAADADRRKRSAQAGAELGDRIGRALGMASIVTALVLQVLAITWFVRKLRRQ